MSILTIPAKRKGTAAFRQRVADLIIDEHTRIYMDTSFLMWMTKVGSNSRQELTNWLRQNCAGRVHVPIWSAHEYFKHHIRGTIVSEFRSKTNEVRQLVRSTYAYFRPFIDEPLGDWGEDPSRIRSEARDTLDRLGRLNERVKNWTKSYDRHASEVISFINDHTPDESTVYEELETIVQRGSGRYAGAIPPGYKDQWKTGPKGQSQQSADEVSAGGNQYGDLMFWREVLLHAKHMSASALVVITNDRKNDWYMGGGDVGEIEPELRRLRQEWKSVPEPHPMLVAEAKLVAKLNQVEILDSLYLAVLLRDLAEKDVSGFADVAIVPDGPDAVRADEDSARVSEAKREFDVGVQVEESRDTPYVFPDSDGVLNTYGHFRRALIESKMELDPESNDLLQSWRAGGEEQLQLAEAIASGAIQEFDHKMLARLARELHDRVQQGTPGYEGTLVDLILVLDQLPPNTAASFYLGLLASMYLDRESNKSRIPPSSPAAELLLARQSRGYAINGVEVISWKLSDNEESPIYLPDTQMPSVTATFGIERNSLLFNQLASLTVQGIELLTAAQIDDTLRLKETVGLEGKTDGWAIIRRACELFVIPYEQVENTGLFDENFSLTDTIGFKRPSTVAVPKGRSDGQ